MKFGPRHPVAQHWGHIQFWSGPRLLKRDYCDYFMLYLLTPQLFPYRWGPKFPSTAMPATLKGIYHRRGERGCSQTQNILVKFTLETSGLPKVGFKLVTPT